MKETVALTMKSETNVSNLSKLESDIIELKNKTMQNVIAMGEKLIEAKKLVPHGQWGKWLEEKVEISHRTANNWMRIAKELGHSNSQAISNLESTKAMLLLDLPDDMRESFLENNNVSNMSTREMKSKISEFKKNKDIDVFKNWANEILEKGECLLDARENMSDKYFIKYIVEKFGNTDYDFCCAIAMAFTVLKDKANFKDYQKFVSIYARRLCEVSDSLR